MQFFTKTALMALSVGQFAYAHSDVTRFYVDGVDEGLGIAYRMNPDGSTFSSPVENLASNDMACGFQGTKGVPRVVDAEDGATFTFLWQNYPNDPSHGVLDPSHHGPCAVYMKKVESAINDPGAGDGWFKIWDDGYDESQKTWCTNKLIDAKGLMTVQLPKGLVGGYYLIRPEILALHNANQGDPQFYMGCAQVFLKSSGSKVPVNTVSIPGYVKAGEPSVSFNIWEPQMKLPYPIPGPAVSTFEDSPVAANIRQTAQTEGGKPDGCIMENANWCGFEVPAYTTESGCWASAQNCWDQGQTCWNTAGPTGGDGCKVWQQKCTDLNNQCSAKNFVGPPNAGKDLTPPRSGISPPSPLGPTVIGTSVVSPETTTLPSQASSAVAITSAPYKYANSSAAAAPTAPAVVKPIASSAQPTPEAPKPSSPITPPENVAPVEDDGGCDDEPEDDGGYGDEKPAETSPVTPVPSAPVKPIEAAPPHDGECGGPATVTVTTSEVVTVVETVTVPPPGKTAAPALPDMPKPKPVSSVAPVISSSAGVAPSAVPKPAVPKPDVPKPAAPKPEPISSVAPPVSSSVAVALPSAGFALPSGARPSNGFALPSGVALPSGFRKLPRPTAPIPFPYGMRD